MNAAIYTRVSTDEQAEKGLSLAAQERRCRERAEQDGATDITLYCDDGYTGTNTDRPALRDLVSHFAAIDVLYVWDLDRLSRDDVDLGLIMRALISDEVAVVSISDGRLDLNTADGRFRARLDGILSQREIEVLSERVTMALRERLHQGRWVGTVPIGYDIERLPDGTAIRGSAWHVVEDQAAIIRRCFAEYDRGASLSEIVQGLRSDDIRGARGGQWNTSHLGIILRNPVYIGKVRAWGEVIDGVHPPIISDDQWRRVQKRLLRRSRTPPRALASGSLSPLCRCGICGSSVARHNIHQGYPRYRCTARVKLPREERHDAVSVADTALRDALWVWVRWVLAERILQRAARERMAASDDDSERHAAEARMAELDAAMADNLSLYDDGLMPRTTLEDRQRPLMAERRDLAEQLRRWEDTDREDVTRLADMTPDTVSRVREQTADFQIAFLTDLIEEVALFPEREVELRPRWGLPVARATLPAYYSPEKRGSVLPDDLWK